MHFSVTRRFSRQGARITQGPVVTVAFFRCILGSDRNNALCGDHIVPCVRPSVPSAVAYCQPLSDFYQMVQEMSNWRYVADVILLICSKPTGVTANGTCIFNRQLHVPALQTKQTNIRLLSPTMMSPNKRQLNENRLTDGHSLFKGANEFLSIISTFLVRFV